jgi:hypothetical protein
MRRAVLTAFVAALVYVPTAGAWTWPAGGVVLRHFHFDPAHPYAAGQHRGIDVAGASGERVLAPRAGTVTFAGTVPSSGDTVTITTDDGLAVTLTHLGSLGVAKGANVAEGAPVGTIGPSDGAGGTQPSVQLGVRIADQAQGYLDPESFLPVRPGGSAPDGGTDSSPTGDATTATTTEPESPAGSSTESPSAPIAQAAPAAPQPSAATGAGATPEPAAAAVEPASADPAPSAVPEATTSSGLVIRAGSAVTLQSGQAARRRAARPSLQLGGDAPRARLSALPSVAADRPRAAAGRAATLHVARRRGGEPLPPNRVRLHDLRLSWPTGAPTAAATGPASRAALARSAPDLVASAARRSAMPALPAALLSAGLLGLLAAAVVAWLRARGQAKALRIIARDGDDTTQDLGGAGVAVRGGLPAPWARGGVRAVRRLRALPPARGQRRAGGERHRRAWDAGHGRRRQGGEVLP